MKRVVRRFLWSIGIPVSAGAIGAAVMCGAVFYYASCQLSASGQGGKEHKKEISSLFQHAPPVPVSPPLVRPITPHKSDSQSASTIPVIPPAMVAELPSFAPLVRQVIPAVVNISISHDPRDREGTETVIGAPEQLAQPSRPGKKSSHSKPRHRTIHRKPRHHVKHRVVHPVDDDMTGAGSGFVIDETGIIVTNRHVVGDATRVTVSLSDGRTLPAHILGDDPMTDIAVIKVESNTRLPYVKWGDSHQVEIGDWILVAGNPFGFGSSVTAGIVSAVGRDLGIGALDDFMQLDAPINPGNSGGPAFNLHGQVIAMNAAIASPSDGSVGIGFGIPSEIVAPVVEEIKKTGHVEHGWLGVTLNDATSLMWVEDVDRNGAAWQAGLRRKDEILAMGGVTVRDARTVLRSVAAAHPGTIFTFTIRRQGEIKTLSVTLGQHPASDF